MAKLIDGKAVAQVVRHEVARGVSEFRARYGRAPGLHVILAGDDPASAVYVRNKEKAAQEVGIDGKVHRLPASVGQAALLALVEELNRDASVDGILVQLPLPTGISASAVVQAVAPAKDVDGLHTVSAGALWSGRPGLVPCTPRGCLRLIEHAEVKLEGARAVVVGRSTLVGKPVAALLLEQNATVTIAHSKSRDLAALCREADVLVAAVGRRNVIQGSFIKPGAVVIDVGTNRDDQGKLCGDVDFAAAEMVAGAITPVPGGVGPMTIAMLLDNTLLAARARAATTARA
ncbi:MAG TPA: bifunctional methylenetetrahydrofolate dehydrogenase/methenyltetrahydrofolate cyclohydrolase FolD [Polyangiaceae bacterium]|nr:bifunctional methylenetetrahydrofolate dehydrogenase/methenyltetrahydrofolate cyclohydrolase FolD [Polyangiaceae bacterium]